MPSFGTVSAMAPPIRVLGVLYGCAREALVENGISKTTGPRVRWLLRKFAQGLPPLPTIGGHALATRVAGLLLVGGAILIGVTVVLPPSADGSDLLILGYGIVAGLAGAMLLSRRRGSEPVLGLAAALGTAGITLSTLEAGQGGGGREKQGRFPLGSP